MAQCVVVYWRDIPAQIIVGAGRKKAKRELPERFIQAIDRCAMRVGAIDTDAYLADWRRGELEPCGDDLDARADGMLAQLENDYPNSVLKILVENEGWATPPPIQNGQGERKG